MSQSVSYQERITIGNVTDTLTRTLTGGSLTQVSEAIPDASTNLAVGFTLDVSACKFLRISADRNITVKTNSSSSPVNTLAIVANEPYVWALGMLPTVLITADVTGLFITNASGAAATLTIEALTDPTP